jgi:hypothetical protein
MTHVLMPLMHGLKTMDSETSLYNSARQEKQIQSFTNRVRGSRLVLMRYDPQCFHLLSK